MLTQKERYITELLREHSFCANLLFIIRKKGYCTMVQYPLYY